MNAAILAIGSEMLGLGRVDTNSLHLTEVLEGYGVETATKAVVGDDEAMIAREIARLLGCVDLVLITGGLGPTADDVTRSAAARALGRALNRDPALVEALRERYARYGRVMPEVNQRQADVIEGAVVLENTEGSAPGQRVDAARSTLFLFPGVPREMKVMCARFLRPWLAEQSASRGLQKIQRRVLKIAGIPESALEERIAPIYESFGRERITVLAKALEIQIHLTAAENQGDELDAAHSEIQKLLGDAVFAEDAGVGLEDVVLELLTARGETLTTAESCTGGMVATRLTAVPGSSSAFFGGVVTYSNELKMQLLNVPKEMLIEHGAVSEPVARAMAEGVRTIYGSTWGIGITGIAGPGGGTEEKPVGTVHLAVAGPGVVEHHHKRFFGDRDRVRRLTAQTVLDRLRLRLLQPRQSHDPEPAD